MRRGSDEFTVFFATDIHGSDRCFKKFINAGKFYGVDAIIIGGDVTGKAVVPVTRGAGGGYSASIAGHTSEVMEDELPRLLDEIRFNGQYPWVTTRDELSAVQADPDGVAKLFHAAITESVNRWLEIAEERLRGTGMAVYISPGNDDDMMVGDLLSASDTIINPDGQVVELAPGVTMLSLGYSNPTPWNSPRELPEDELERRLSTLATQLPSSGITIHNIHVPPFGTIIDQAAQLDSDLRPVVHGGQVSFVHVGSTAVRRVLEATQPTLGLHGHIHESPGAVKVGRTLCVNPGSEYNDGVLRGVIVRMQPSKGKVGYQLTVG